VFDIAGPLVSYSLLRSAGQSPVPALVPSGACPAFGAYANFLSSATAEDVAAIYPTEVYNPTPET
jgi:hypothetical protein